MKHGGFEPATLALARRYSTTEPLAQNQYLIGSAQNRNRTSDTRIFSPLLYRLSYLGLPSLVCTSDAINNTL